MAEKIQVEYEADISKLKKQLQDLNKEQKKVGTQAEKNSKTIQSSAQMQEKKLTSLINLRRKLLISGKNESFIKQVDKEIKGLEKAGKATKKLTTETKKFKKETSGLEKTLLNIGKGLLLAFSVQALISFGKQLNKTAIQMQAFQRRAEIVFGEGIKLVKDFAEQNAISLGLTQNELLGATAAIGDMIVPLGLGRDRAAEMSVELLKTGVALKIFTGDSRDASEISDILARALTGEVESLKPLGVSIAQNSKEFKDLVQSKMEDEGATLLQAKALAIYESILQRSGDAINSFETDTDSLALAQLELSANVRTLTEDMALLLTPIFKGVTDELIKQVEAVSEAETGFDKFLQITKRILSPLQLMTTIQSLLRKETDDLAVSFTHLEGVMVDVISTTEALQRAKRELVDVFGGELMEILSVTEALRQEVRNVFFLEAALRKLKTEQKDQTTSVARVKEITQELIPLQKELNDLLGKQKEKVEKVDDAWKKLDKTLRQDIRDAFRNTGISELDLEFNSILEDMDKFQNKLDDIDTLAQLRFENLVIQSEFASAGVQSLSDIQAAATDARIEQLKELGLSQQEFARQSELIREEGESTQKALFVLEKLLATSTVILNLQREISIIGATPLPAPLKAAEILNARARAGVSLITIAGTSIAGLAEGEIDIKGGRRGKDSIPALLMPGESVIKTKGTEKYKEELTAANNLTLESVIEHKYVLPALKKMSQEDAFIKRWVAENSYDDTGVIRQLKKPVKIQNVSELSRAIAKEQQNQAYFRS